MWNLLKYIPDTFDALKARGIEYECPLRMFKAELKRATGVMTEKTIGNWMNNLVELGYIKNKGEFVIELCIDFDHPYNFYSANVPEVVKPRSTPELDAKVENIKAAKILHEK